MTPNKAVEIGPAVKNEGKDKWSTPDQNKLAEKIGEVTQNKLKGMENALPIRIVQSGDSLGAIVGGIKKSGAIEGVKNIYNLKVEFPGGREFSNMLASDLPSIHEGQKVWVEDGKIIVADGAPTSQTVKNEVVGSAGNEGGKEKKKEVKVDSGATQVRTTPIEKTEETQNIFLESNSAAALTGAQLDSPASAPRSSASTSAPAPESKAEEIDLENDVPREDPATKPESKAEEIDLENDVPREDPATKPESKAEEIDLENDVPREDPATKPESKAEEIDLENDVPREDPATKPESKAEEIDLENDVPREDPATKPESKAEEIDLENDVPREDPATKPESKAEEIDLENDVPREDPATKPESKAEEIDLENDVPREDPAIESEPKAEKKLSIWGKAWRNLKDSFRGHPFSKEK